MLQVERAVLLALALVADGPLPVVAVHAVVVPAATVVGRDVAAKVAFVLDVGLFVGLAIGDAETVVRFLPKKFTLWTLHALEHGSSKEARWVSFHLSILLFLQPPHILIVAARPETSKVRPFACLALEVVEMIHSKLCKVVEVLALGVTDALIQIQALVFRSQHSLFLDLFLKVFSLVHHLVHVVQVRALVELHELVARGALCILQTDGIRVRVYWLGLRLSAEATEADIMGKPFLLNLSLDAIKVKDMLAAKLYNCLLT